MSIRRMKFEGKSVYFGPSATECTVSLLKENNIKHCFICLDEGLSKTELFKTFLARFEGSGIETTVFDHIVPNPRSVDIMEGAARLNESGADCVIGFGGGSSMDSSKVIAAMSCNEGDIIEYETHAEPRRRFRTKNHFTVGIPTTAGTGSEMDAMSVVVNNVGHKVTIADPKLTYDLVIVDSNVLENCPPRVIASCGIDAFCHSFESLIGNIDMVFSGIAIKAADLVYKNLLGAYRKRSMVYRERLMQASFLSGCVLGFEPSPSGVPVHSIGLPLSEKYHYSHGESMALVLPYILDKVAENDPHQIAVVARKLGVDEQDDRICAKVFIMNLQELIISCGLTNTEGRSAGKEDIEELAEMACRSGTTTGNRILPFNNEMCQDVYQKVFDHYLVKM